MYAVFGKNIGIVYLGYDLKEAVSYVDSEPYLKGTLVNVRDLDELAACFAENFSKKEEPTLTAQATDQLSAAADAVLNKLDELGLNEENAEELARKVRQSSELAIGQARSLGIQGMKAVGDGFIALGDLLRKASADEKKS